jgi:imidazole glycerol-phosphate synthase subunit HisF
MIAKRIIPCLDVKDGIVVKGTNFVSLRELGDPVAMAAAYSKSGADEIVFLDIPATHEGRATMMDIVRQTVLHLSLSEAVFGRLRT